MNSLNSISLKNCIDNHIHCCPHINKRSIDIFETAEAAEKEGMFAIGLMDNFANSAAYASLIKKKYPDFKLKVFGGIIMEPYTGGIDYHTVKTLYNYGYMDSEEVCKFISLPTHHTKFTAINEKRKQDYIDNCFSLSNLKKVDESFIKILKFINNKKIVLNSGHISGKENENLVKLASDHNINKILIPANHLHVQDILKIKKIADVYFEFSYFFISEATDVPLTHIDEEQHVIQKLKLDDLKNLINAAGVEKTILSSDCGVSILPKPIIGFKIFINEIKKLGFKNIDIQKMTRYNSLRLFYEKKL